ncbi:hypothetical protein ACOI22_13755 [Glaciecola sp. 2405UD65-10]|uniref:hypothetical protein n=1 Tax=Glaciecola sp. 2405UD65-10 TaxID=3397244 RepID=UPI003B592866
MKHNKRFKSDKNKSGFYRLIGRYMYKHVARLSCFIFLLASTQIVNAIEWYSAPELTDKQLESFRWLDSDTNCEVLASKVELAVSVLDTKTFDVLDKGEVQSYASENCDLSNFKHHIIARGLYFCCIGAFGVATVDDKLIVGYSGLGKTPTYQKSAVIVGLNKLPSEVFTVVFVSE